MVSESSQPTATDVANSMNINLQINAEDRSDPDNDWTSWSFRESRWPIFKSVR